MPLPLETDSSVKKSLYTQGTLPTAEQGCEAVDLQMSYRSATPTSVESLTFSCPLSALCNVPVCRLKQ